MVKGTITFHGAPDANRYEANFGTVTDEDGVAWGYAVMVTDPFDGLKDWQSNDWATDAKDAITCILRDHQQALATDRGDRFDSDECWRLRGDAEVIAWWKYVALDRPTQFRWPYFRRIFL